MCEYHFRIYTRLDILTEIEQLATVRTSSGHRPTGFTDDGVNMTVIDYSA